SGGNQQKVVLAKWLFSDSRIIIFDEPTRGIDVGAKREIYEIINELTAEGKAVIVISSDMEEIMGLCDRILVLCEGRVTGEVGKENFSQKLITECAVGGVENE
ncbi:MAG: D-xylose ABC transporter ATP-binding protein, partial [Oscillospiraceae bacterium]